MYNYKVIAIYVCIDPDKAPMSIASFSNSNAAYVYKEACEIDCPQCKYTIELEETND